MQAFEPLLAEKFYHIYNHCVGRRDLFRTPHNYEYFLSLYDKYIEPVAETYAWVLMKNHFHLLVKVREDVTAFATPDRVSNPVRGNLPSLQFSKLFNSYAQAYNKRYQTRGALFERPFKRKRIDNEEYLRRVILYIHNNPVHHGFCEHAMDYPWSSYLTCVSIKPTKLHRESVIGWFDDAAHFKMKHDEKLDVNEIDNWLKI